MHGLFQGAEDAGGTSALQVLHNWGWDLSVHRGRKSFPNATFRLTKKTFIVGGLCKFQNFFTICFFLSLDSS